VSSLPASHSYLQHHYTSPEEPSKDSRLRFLKKFVTRCITHFTRSQNEFNANVVRTLDDIHQRSEQNEHHYLDLSNALTQATNALRQQQRINKRAEETQEHMSGSAKSLQDMQNHHGAVISQALQKLSAVEQKLNDTLDQKLVDSRLEFENRADFADSKINDMSTRQDELVSLLESFRKETQALSKRNDALVKQIHDTNLHQHTFEKSFSALIDRIDDTCKRQDDLVALVESFTRESKGVSKRIDDLVVHVNGTNNRQSELVSTVKTIAAQRKAISKRQDDLVSQCNAIATRNDDVTKRQDDLVSQCNDANIRQADIIGTIKAVAARNDDVTKRQDDLVASVNKQVPALIKDTGVIAESIHRVEQDFIERINRVEQGFTDLNSQLQSMIKRTLLLRETLDEAVAHIPSKGAGKQEKAAFVSAMLECSESMKDTAYELFEDANRGSENEIKERLAYYIPKLKNITTSASSYILDIGCGRGEFMQLLADAGYHAKGIDINRAAVSEGKTKGLSVKHADLFAELNRIKPNSLAAISAFHVIEHMPFDQIFRFIELAFSRLKPGGVIMLETPNALNLRVAACEFYRDPTHVKPVHPSTLDHALQQAGFSSIAFDFLHPFPAQDSLTVKSKSFSKAASHNFETLNDLILGCRDCAVTASKLESS